MTACFLNEEIDITHAPCSTESFLKRAFNFPTCTQSEVRCSLLVVATTGSRASFQILREQIFRFVNDLPLSVDRGGFFFSKSREWRGSDSSTVSRRFKLLDAISPRVFDCFYENLQFGEFEMSKIQCAFCRIFFFGGWGWRVNIVEASNLQTFSNCASEICRMSLLVKYLADSRDDEAGVQCCWSLHKIWDAADIFIL